MSLLILRQPPPRLKQMQILSRLAVYPSPRPLRLRGLTGRAAEFLGDVIGRPINPQMAHDVCALRDLATEEDGVDCGSAGCNGGRVGEADEFLERGIEVGDVDFGDGRCGREGGFVGEGGAELPAEDGLDFGVGLDDFDVPA